MKDDRIREESIESIQDMHDSFVAVHGMEKAAVLNNLLVVVASNTTALEAIMEALIKNKGMPDAWLRELALLIENNLRTCRTSIINTAAALAMLERGTTTDPVFHTAALRHAEHFIKRIDAATRRK
jgi:hypothetical protein